MLNEALPVDRKSFDVFRRKLPKGLMHPGTSRAERFHLLKIH